MSEEQAPKWEVGEGVYVTISKPQKFNEGPGMRRTGFAKIAFNKQSYVTVTITDHRSGHGQVKSVILRNPDPQFLLKVMDPSYWTIKKREMQLVTDEGVIVERVFREVYLLTPDGDKLMSNSVEIQMKNLAQNTQIRIEGQDCNIIAYVNAAGKHIALVTPDDDDDDDDDDTKKGS